jgi:hypothetical protein
VASCVPWSVLDWPEDRQAGTKTQDFRNTGTHF